MTTSQEQLSGHERFSELCTLAMSGALTVHESAQLNGHLQTCLVCRKAYREYVVLTREGIPYLASRYSSLQEQGNWDDTEVRRKLLARVRAEKTPTLLEQLAHLLIRAPRLLLPRRIASDPFVAMAVAACVVLAVSVGAFWYGQRIEAAARLAVASVTVSTDDRVQMLTSEKQAVDNLLGAQSQKLGLLQVESSEKQKKIEKLHSELTALQEHANELEASNTSSVEDLRSIAQEREALRAQLQEARQAYDAVQAELVGLRTDRDKASLRLASLEVQVSKLSTANRELQSNLESASQFLSSDRDIRELMGARNLYIADVFDVDSGSRTRKPFGRIFYTQGKLLIFYAFDLDRQPGLRNTSAFQAWGQRETPKGETAQPVNLGILYMDNETNRRWALRCDDPQELAEIDAVFVTVEPHGGSQKPTGEPLLYAMLRKEANHP